MLARIFALTILFFITSCNSGIGESINYTNLHFVNQEQNIPIIVGKTTHGIAIIKNNSNTPIDNISYQVFTNGGHESNIFEISPDNCNNISANSTCNLFFSINGSNQENITGSSTIEMSYNIGSKKFLQSTIVNYSKTEQNKINIIPSSRYGTQDNPKYDVLYIVNPESNEYILESLNSLSNGLSILNSITYSSNIKPNSVTAIPIEFSTQQSTAKIEALLLNKSLNQTSSLTVSLAAYNKISGANLTYGILPLINAESTLNSSITIMNSGDTTATLNNITLGSGLALGSGINICNTTAGSNTLAPGSSCTIYFTISSNISGNANININYTGGVSPSISPNVSWFYGAGPIFSMSFSSAYGKYPAYATLIPNGGSTPVTVTITNISKYPATIGTITPSTSFGSATANYSNNNCTGTTLNVAKPSCTFIANVSNIGILKQSINISYTTSNGAKSITQIPAPWNVYNLNTWADLGNQGNGVESLFYTDFSGSAATFGSAYATSMVLDPITKQPYLAVLYTSNNSNNNTGFIVYTYTGTSWKQVGNKIVLATTYGNGTSITGIKIAINPITKKIWVATGVNQIAVNLNIPIYFYYLNTSTNTWIQNSTLQAKSPTIQVAAGYSFDMKIDSNGTMYVAYIESATNKLALASCTENCNAFTVLGNNLSQYTTRSVNMALTPLPYESPTIAYTQSSSPTLVSVIQYNPSNNTFNSTFGNVTSQSVTAPTLRAMNIAIDPDTLNPSVIFGTIASNLYLYTYTGSGWQTESTMLGLNVGAITSLGFTIKNNISYFAYGSGNASPTQSIYVKRYA
ncbi:MAG: hypothetical protein PHC75_04255 [Burkholderiales bacterium]|nr:hypothetical protein [Burkholderiales bacterium]